MRLLLADDDADQLALRVLTLQKEGHDVQSACDYETALRVAAAQRPEMAVVDLRMPAEEVGLRLIRELKRLDSGLRIVVLTGADLRRFEAAPERALVEAVIQKGNATRQFLEYLQQFTADRLRQRLAQEKQLVLDVKVTPRAVKTGIAAFLADGSLRVKLAAVAEKGQANRELVELLADFFAVRKDAVEIVAGETSQRKRLRIRKFT